MHKFISYLAPIVMFLGARILLNPFFDPGHHTRAWFHRDTSSMLHTPRNSTQALLLTLVWKLFTHSGERQASLGTLSIHMSRTGTKQVAIWPKARWAWRCRSESQHGDILSSCCSFSCIWVWLIVDNLDDVLSLHSWSLYMNYRSFELCCPFIVHWGQIQYKNSFLFLYLTLLVIVLRMVVWIWILVWTWTSFCRRDMDLVPDTDVYIRIFLIGYLWCDEYHDDIIISWWLADPPGGTASQHMWLMLLTLMYTFRFPLLLMLSVHVLEDITGHMHFYRVIIQNYMCHNTDRVGLCWQSWNFKPDCPSKINHMISRL